jgi:hypothetical protein
VRPASLVLFRRDEPIGGSGSLVSRAIRTGSPRRLLDRPLNSPVVPVTFLLAPCHSLKDRLPRGLERHLESPRMFRPFAPAEVADEVIAQPGVAESRALVGLEEVEQAGTSALDDRLHHRHLLLVNDVQRSDGRIS